MNSLDHRIALTLIAFLTGRGDKIACDLGMLTLHSDGDYVRHCTGKLVNADGTVSTFAVSIAVGATT